MPSKPLTVRIALVRCDPDNFELISDKMEKSEHSLRAGIEAMPGLLAYYAGADAATLTLTNVSFWDSVEHAKQLDTFEPMVALARELTADGGRPERPVMNHTLQWSFGLHLIDESQISEPAD